jgi:hypothetical protein
MTLLFDYMIFFLNGQSVTAYGQNIHGRSITVYGLAKITMGRNVQL